MYPVFVASRQLYNNCYGCDRWNGFIYNKGGDAGDAGESIIAGNRRESASDSSFSEQATGVSLRLLQSFF